jgi:hypothetical protein
MKDISNLTPEQLLHKVAKLKGFDYDSLHDTFSRIENGCRVWYDIPSYKECLKIINDL